MTKFLVIGLFVEEFLISLKRCRLKIQPYHKLKQSDQNSSEYQFYYNGTLNDEIVPVKVYDWLGKGFHFESQIPKNFDVTACRLLFVDGPRELYISRFNLDTLDQTRLAHETINCYLNQIKTRFASNYLVINYQINEFVSFLKCVCDCEKESQLIKSNFEPKFNTVIITILSSDKNLLCNLDLELFKSYINYVIVDSSFMSKKTFNKLDLQYIYGRFIYMAFDRVDFDILQQAMNGFFLNNETFYQGRNYITTRTNLLGDSLNLDIGKIVLSKTVSSSFLYDSLEDFISSSFFSCSQSIYFLFVTSELMDLLKNSLISLCLNKISVVLFFYGEIEDILLEISVFPISIVKMGIKYETFMETVFQKFVLTYQFLKLGKTVIYSDIDIIYLQNRVQEMLTFLLSSDSDILVQSTATSLYCTGYYMVKSNSRTISAFNVNYKDFSFFKGGDQHYFNNMVAPRLNIIRLPPWSYPVGKFYKRLLDKLEPVLIHFNSFSTTDEKIDFITRNSFNLNYYFRRYYFVFLVSNQNWTRVDDIYNTLLNCQFDVNNKLINTSKRLIIITDMDKYLFPNTPSVYLGSDSIKRAQPGCFIQVKNNLNFRQLLSLLPHLS